MSAKLFSLRYINTQFCTSEDTTGDVCHAPLEFWLRSKFIRCIYHPQFASILTLLHSKVDRMVYIVRLHLNKINYNGFEVKISEIMHIYQNPQPRPKAGQAKPDFWLLAWLTILWRPSLSWHITRFTGSGERCTNHGIQVHEKAFPQLGKPQ